MFRSLYRRESTPVLIVQQAGWGPEPVFVVLEKRKYLTLPGLEPRTVQPIYSHYTDCDVPAPWIPSADSFLPQISRTLILSTTVAQPIPVAVRSEEQVRGCPFAGIVDRIPPKAWMLVSCVCCVLCKQWGLRRADRSFRGVLPGVCVCVRVCICMICNRQQ